LDTVTPQGLGFQNKPMVEDMKLKALMAFIAIFVASAAQAADKGSILLGEDKFRISGGGFLANLNSSLEIHPMGEDANKPIDVEKDLGLSSSPQTFKVDGYWRVGPRHRIMAGYYALDRSGANTLETEVEWEDSVYPVGVTVDSSIKLKIIPITYAYSFVKNEQWEVAASIGIHWTVIDTSISGMAFVGDEMVLISDQATNDVKGPLPHIGLHVDFAPSPKWQIGTSIQYLDMSISKYHGKLIDFKIYAEYYIWRNVGIGIAYNYVDIQVGVADEDFVGQVGLQFDGPMGYLVAKF
jgi:hypothetical protein